ncbi:MAG: type II secretion system protein GspN [Candidatus Binatus sp.]|uniref:type II secretion system protein GspN n=1 Tax=Candidatus Binatus sp. TaxID=2811406 RepID=UPI00271ADD40|nr:type II secretion system protein GspN [Candidatus Binatus sp.]MDO8432963.1 type II secretion system protein GspN [Candidatus Binatus sp.]
MLDSRREVPAQSSQIWLVRSSYALFGVVLFLAFVIATFPYSATLTNLLAPMAMQISIADQHLDFPFGARLSDVRVTSATSGAPVFESPAVSVTPSFLSLLMLHLGVHVNADLYGGVGKVTARPSGGGTALSFDLKTVDISRQHLYQLPGVTASGILSGNGEFWISRDDFEKNTGRGDLSASSLLLSTVITPIRLANAVAKFKLDQGVLTIESLKTAGGDLILDASGTIQIGPDADSTILALQFTLTPTPAGADRFRFLPALLPPHPPGSPEAYQITGALSAPRIR